MESDDDENSDTESDEEMEDINLLDVVKGFHTSLKTEVWYCIRSTQ